MRLLTKRQLDIIQANKETFGTDLRVGYLSHYNPKTGTWEKPYTVFLYVVNLAQDRPVDYLTSLGEYQDYTLVIAKIKELLHG